MNKADKKASMKVMLRKTEEYLPKINYAGLAIAMLYTGLSLHAMDQLLRKKKSQTYLKVKMLSRNAEHHR